MRDGDRWLLIGGIWIGMTKGGELLPCAIKTGLDRFLADPKYDRCLGLRQAFDGPQDERLLERARQTGDCLPEPFQFLSVAGSLVSPRCRIRHIRRLRH